MNDPIRRFETEHDEALHVLTSVEAAADGLMASERVERHLKTLREAHRFLSTAVRQHNEDEERSLFRVLGDDAPVAIFIEEHRVLRQLEDQLLAALDGGSPRDAAPRIAFDLVDLLRRHIERENTVLFPMARARLGPAGLARVADRLV